MSEPAIKIKAKDMRNTFGTFGVIAAIIAFFMIFAPALKFSGDLTFADGSGLSYKGYEVCFGYYYDGYYTHPSANMVTYILLIVGIVFTCLALGNKFSKASYIIAIVAFALAALGFVLTDAFMVYGEKHKELSRQYGGLPVSLGGGAIAGIILSLIAFIFEIVSFAVSKKFRLIY